MTELTGDVENAEKAANEEKAPFVDQTSTELVSKQQNTNSKRRTLWVLATVIILILVIVIIIIIVFVTKNNQQKEATESDNECNGYSNDLIVVAFDGLKWDYMTDEYQSKWNIDLSNFSKVISQGVHIQKVESVFPSLTYPNFYTMATGLYPAWHGIPWNTFFDPQLNLYKNKSNDDDETGIWWLSNPIWTGIQDNKKMNNESMRSAVIYWKGSRSNNNNNGNNNGFPDWTLKNYEKYLDFYVRSDYLLSKLNASHFNLAMIYYNEPDSTAHKYGPDDNRTAHKMQYNDNVLGYFIQKLDELYSNKYTDKKYNLMIVSDHGFTKCIVPSPLILNMTDLDIYFINQQLRFDTTFQGRVSAPQIVIKIMDTALTTQNVIDMFRAAIVNASRYENELFWFYTKNEIPFDGYGVDASFDYRLSDVMIDVKLGYEWNIIGSYKYNRTVNCGGGHSWDPTEDDMMSVAMAVGPDFKSNYIKTKTKNIHFYELMCKLLCETQPQPNNGSLDEIKDILI
eukprot:194287_1